MTTRTERPSPVLLALLVVVIVFAAVHFGRQLVGGESSSVAEPVDDIGSGVVELSAETPPEWVTPDQPRNPFVPAGGASARIVIDASELPDEP